MKTLYYASYVLSAPFYAVAWVLYGASWMINGIGDAIHDATTCKAWLVLHRRACSKPNAPREVRGASPRNFHADVGHFESESQSDKKGGEDHAKSESIPSVS